MNNWTGRLKAKMQELGFTQEDLANKLGVTRSAVAHYVQGTRHPPIKQVIKLASILQVDPAWLQFGKAQETTTQSHRSKKDVNRIPILDWHQVIDFQSDYANAKYEYLDYFNRNQIECVALLVKGDSMVAPMSQSMSFPQGSYIILDPNKMPINGNYVLASSSKKDAILRQYIEEGGDVYLKPLNPQYPLLQLERKIKILGVVVANIIIL